MRIKLNSLLVSGFLGLSILSGCGDRNSSSKNAPNIIQQEPPIEFKSVSSKPPSLSYTPLEYCIEGKVEAVGERYCEIGNTVKCSGFMKILEECIDGENNVKRTFFGECVPEEDLICCPGDIKYEGACGCGDSGRLEAICEERAIPVQQLKPDGTSEIRLKFVQEWVSNDICWDEHDEIARHTNEICETIYHPLGETVSWCIDGEDDSCCDLEYCPEIVKADIVLVVDNSGSMVEETPSLATGIRDFTLDANNSALLQKLRNDEIYKYSLILIKNDQAELVLNSGTYDDLVNQIEYIATQPLLGGTEPNYQTLQGVLDQDQNFFGINYRDDALPVIVFNSDEIGDNDNVTQEELNEKTIENGFKFYALLPGNIISHYQNIPKGVNNLTSNAGHYEHGWVAQTTFHPLPEDYSNFFKITFKATDRCTHNSVICPPEQ